MKLDYLEKIDRSRLFRETSLASRVEDKNRQLHAFLPVRGRQVHRSNNSN